MMMEPGKFYCHEKGRKISVSGEVHTHRWGKCLVVEETDRTGHSVSVVQQDTMPDMGTGWVEIGMHEFLSGFDHVSCDGCDAYIVKGQRYVMSDEGVYHSRCYRTVIADGVRAEKVEEIIK